MESNEVMEKNREEAIRDSLASQAATSRRSQNKMDQSLAHSLAWRAATNWASQVLSWTSLLVVVRLLAPADFGIAAMAVVLWPYLRYLGEFGIPQTVVTFQDLDEDQLAQLNSIGWLLGLGCFGIAVLLSHPMAAFFRTPRLAPVVVVTCIALIPQGCRAVSEGLLTKEMRFGLLSWFEAIRSIVAALTTLVLAYLHFGYWALVLGNLVASFTRSALILAARPHSLARPRISSIRRQLTFGWHVLVSVVAWSAYERLDNVTAGRRLGQAALGIYAMAWNLANIPLEKVTTLVTTIVPSYLAAVQNDSQALRRYLRALTETMALATFPATIGLALVARELIPVALGAKWQGVILPLEVLSVYAAFRSVVALLSKVLVAIGDARFVMWNDLWALGVLPCAFLLGSHWGTQGIAWGWVAAYPLVAVPLYRRTFSRIRMSGAEYIRALRPALDSTLIMTAAVLLLKRALPSHEPLVARLLFEIATGAAAYLLTLFAGHRKRILLILETAKAVRGKREAGVGLEQANLPA